MKKVFSSKYQGSSMPVSLPLGALITAFIFLTLPLTQIISNIGNNEKDDNSSRVKVQPPPPLPPEPPEKEEEEQQEDDIEMKKEEQQLTLEQINMAINAGDGGMSSSGVSVQIFNISDSFDDMVFEIQDLDKHPHPIVRVKPIFPPGLKRQRVEATVRVIFIVDENGDVKRPRIGKGSKHKEFNDNAIKAVRQWKFEPGEKDGKKVKTRVRLPLSFKLK